MILCIKLSFAKFVVLAKPSYMKDKAAGAICRIDLGLSELSANIQTNSAKTEVLCGGNSMSRD